MGQRESVGGFDGEDKIVGNALGISLDHPNVRQLDLSGKKALKPQVDLDGIQQAGVIGQIVVGPISLSLVIH
jgi:hypothetical protein